jgi:hypothetical protein
MLFRLIILLSLVAVAVDFPLEQVVVVLAVCVAQLRQLVAAEH